MFVSRIRKVPVGTKRPWDISLVPTFLFLAEVPFLIIVNFLNKGSKGKNVLYTPEKNCGRKIEWKIEGIE